jgi:methionyl-tRNA synthetase
MIQNPKDMIITACLILTDPFTLAIWQVFTYLLIFILVTLRLQGRDVLFVCGSDEHGVAISMKAKKKGLHQEVIDKYDGIIRKSFIDFDISFDNYSRTSAKIHHDTASEFFTTLYEKVIL